MDIEGARAELRAFTRADLCAVVVVAGLLGLVLGPALAAGGRGVGRVICQDNLRRLAAAWTMYADENGGRMVGNPHTATASNPMPNGGYWAVGWLTWNADQANTNATYLVDDRYGALGAYVGRDTLAYRCPDDTHLGEAQRAWGWAGRVRTYSMNYLMGGVEEMPFVKGYRKYRKLADMNVLAPAQAVLLVEEQPDSMNDPALLHAWDRTTWVDCPGAFHENDSWIAFADGHVESRTWTSKAIVMGVRFTSSPDSSPAASDADFKWMSAHVGEKE